MGICYDQTKGDQMAKLILLRHGQSYWNQQNIFTGWVDIPLSPKGIEEALESGRLIRDIPVDVIFTSSLVRAQTTAFLAMSQHKTKKTPIVQHQGNSKIDEWSKIYSTQTANDTIPVFYSPELNERMYGELQGLNKDEMAKKFGAEQVHIWRRSYNTAPPKGESLAMTADRTLPYFTNKILPFLQQEKNVLISAHGNSLRAISMKLDHLSHEEVVHLEIPTGLPIIYNFENNKFVKQ
jgi:2,3-bisphosphoglycerate-dependent phosphoglycerate mutase